MPSGSSSPPSYAPLHGKEERDSIDGLDMLPLHRSRSPRRKNAIKAAKIISALVLVAFIVLTFALSFHAVDLLGKIGHLIKEPKPASHQRSYKYPCGQTAAEAKEKGCIFDIMSMAWHVFPIPVFFMTQKKRNSYHSPLGNHPNASTKISTKNSWISVPGNSTLMKLPPTN